MYDLIIIGGGPAGMSAAIYAARYGLNLLLIERTAVGGQMNLTATIENYPGFDEPVSGYVLGSKMLAQVEHLGVEVKYTEVIELSLKEDIKKIKTEDGVFEAKTVILSMGASPKKLGINGENKFLGRGVSYCGTCDAPLFKDKVVAAIGGGDTALEESIILAQHAKKVYLVHRRDQFRGQKFLVDQVRKTKNIEILYNRIPV
ncbi:MAG: FAD-dependent oxidoreductase, partial [Spirochaetota bacterium]